MIFDSLLLFICFYFFQNVLRKNMIIGHYLIGYKNRKIKNRQNMMNNINSVSKVLLRMWEWIMGMGELGRRVLWVKMTVPCSVIWLTFKVDEYNSRSSIDKTTRTERQKTGTINRSGFGQRGSCGQFFNISILSL